MRTITTQELKDANRKAYAEKRLSAQAQKAHCVYRSPDHSNGCAIGVALNADELKLIDDADFNNSRISKLIMHGIVTFEDIIFAQTLQDLHDNWVGSPASAAHEGKYRAAAGIDELA